MRYAPEASGARMPQELDPSIDNFGVHRVEWLPGRINWEGAGVMPDVEVPAASALDAALERARKR